MAAYSTTRKVLQVYEEAAPVVQIPVMVGNELFLLTQQDVRRTEDIRLLSYNRLSANDQRCSQFPTNVPPATPHICTLQDLLNYQVGKGHRFEDQVNVEHPRTGADVSQQMCWSKKHQSSAPFSLKYSTATSTTDLCQHTNKCNQHCPNTRCNTCQTSNIQREQPKDLESPQRNQCADLYSRQQRCRVRFQQQNTESEPYGYCEPCASEEEELHTQQRDRTQPRKRQDNQSNNWHE